MLSCSVKDFDVSFNFPVFSFKRVAFSASPDLNRMPISFDKEFDSAKVFSKLVCKILRSSSILSTSVIISDASKFLYMNFEKQK